MEYEELKETVKKLKEALKRENNGKVDEYTSFEDMERRSRWYQLYLALEDFIEYEL